MGKRTRTAHCRLTAFGEAVLSFPFSAELVDALKTSIPSRFRSYDPRHKSWMIGPEYVDLAVEILLEHFPDAEVPRRARKYGTAGGGGSASSHFQVLHLLPTAPPELIGAAYRCLAKIHHPDKGGDSSIMRRLTEAHDALARRLSA